METIFIVLVAVVAMLMAFAFGIIVGIKDCKRRFNIPAGELPIT